MDTDTRKYSAVNLSSPWRGICNIPSETLDEPEQFSIVYLYNEFAAVPPADQAGGVGAPTRMGGMMIFG